MRARPVLVVAGERGGDRVGALVSRTDQWYVLRGATKAAFICAFIAAALFLAARGDLDPVNAAPQMIEAVRLEAHTLAPSTSAGAAPYQPCPKLKRGKWLRAEIAHQVKDGWRIDCLYEGDALMTREELRL